MEITADQIRSGVEAAYDLWVALAYDDDTAVEQLLPADAIDALGLRAGIARRVRAHLGVDRATCACMGLVSPVSILSESRIRVMFVRGHQSPRIAALHAPQRKWLEARLDEGAWMVDPVCARVAPVIGIATVDVQELPGP